MLADLRKRNDTAAALKPKLWILQYKYLTPASHWHVWQSLVHSRFSYAVELVTQRSQRMTNWYRDQIYRATKALLGIKAHVDKDRLLTAALGEPWKDWLAGRQRKLNLRLDE